MPGSKAYIAAWQRERKKDPVYRAALNAYNRAWRKANYAKIRDSVIRRSRAWALANPDKRRAAARRYSQRHPDIKLAQTVRREAAKLQRLPAWADHEKIGVIYAAARRRTQRTGRPHEVDHVLPLRGRLVSGLHVHQNLKILPRTLNRRKSAKYVP